MEHPCCCRSLTAVNNASINMGVQLLLLQSDLHSFRYIPRSGIAGSYDSSISIFFFFSIEDPPYCLK
jgi:hypothetical protein